MLKSPLRALLIKLKKTNRKKPKCLASPSELMNILRERETLIGPWQYINTRNNKCCSVEKAKMLSLQAYTWQSHFRINLEVDCLKLKIHS